MLYRSSLFSLMNKNNSKSKATPYFIASKRPEVISSLLRVNKKLVSISKMKDRIKAAVDAREDESFVIMARSDALAVENEKMLHERLESYIEAGADMIFPEALTKLSQYKYISKNFLDACKFIKEKES